MSSNVSTYDPPADLSGLRSKALIVGVVGLVALGAGFATNPQQAFRSYLVGFVFMVSIPAGCLALSVLHHMTRGAWGLMIRRILEAGTRTLPFALVLFIPVVLGLKKIFPWTEPAIRHHLPHNQQIYLDEKLFTIRTIVYFALWAAVAFILSALSKKQDETGDPLLARRMQMIAGPGILIYGFAASFASFDWLMSLNVAWFSSIYGMHFVVGQLVTAMSVVILMLAFLSKRAPMRGVYQKRHFHDVGKLLLAFTLLWAYLSVSQYMIIWSGNLPEEIGWYMVRNGEGWKAYSIFLVFGHFVIPFALLLSAARKKDIDRLARVAVWMLVMRVADLIWQTSPALFPEVHLSWLDAAAPIALGAVWFWLFLGQLAGRPLLPVNEPNLPEALSHG